MGHKSWGGARLNKWDREFHTEPQGERYYVQLDIDLHYVVIDSESDRVVFSDEDKLTCECECELLNSQEE